MSDQSSVIPLTSRRMSETDYDRERQRIRDLFGDSRSDAGTRWEQALAQLFWRSGWTQEELASKEGKSKSWISQRLIFGRFLTFVDNNSAESTSGGILTERLFRQYWEQTDVSNERRRFRQVIEMMVTERRAGTGRNRNALMDLVREHYSNGKWHATDAIAKRLGKEQDEIERVMAAATSRGARRYKIERRRRGRDFQYRIFSMEKTVSTVELTEKLGPLILDLKAEGSKNMATIAITRIAKIAAELQQMIDEWTR